MNENLHDRLTRARRRLAARDVSALTDDDLAMLEDALDLAFYAAPITTAAAAATVVAGLQAEAEAMALPAPARCALDALANYLTLCRVRENM